METEFAAPVTFTHTLGAGLFYFTNPYTGKINFGDGTPAVASGSDAHQMLLGKDSPQVATKTSQTATTTTWTVQPGGRMGGVLGEDAVELSQGATNCTSDCQAQNQIRGSLPVPPDPVDPQPLGPRRADAPRPGGAVRVRPAPRLPCARVRRTGDALRAARVGSVGGMNGLGPGTLNVATIVAEGARRHRNKTAVVTALPDGLHELSYGDLWEQVRATAGGLRARGVGRGDGWP